jgi:hypothetical protein
MPLDGKNGLHLEVVHLERCETFARLHGAATWKEGSHVLTGHRENRKSHLINDVYMYIALEPFSFTVCSLNMLYVISNLV